MWGRERELYARSSHTHANSKVVDAEKLELNCQTSSLYWSRPDFSGKNPKNIFFSRNGRKRHITIYNKRVIITSFFLLVFYFVKKFSRFLSTSSHLTRPDCDLMKINVCLSILERIEFEIIWNGNFQKNSNKPDADFTLVTNIVFLQAFCNYNKTCSRPR